MSREDAVRAAAEAIGCPSWHNTGACEDCEAAVAAAEPFLRAAIAAEIERGIDDPPCNHADCEAERNAYRDAARIARGTP